MRLNIPVLNGVEYALLLRCEEEPVVPDEFAENGANVNFLVDLGLLKAVDGFLMLTTAGARFIASRRELYWAVIADEDPVEFRQMAEEHMV